MKPFNLEEYLASTEKKVVTRGGADVEIICTNGREPLCIIGYIDGHQTPTFWCSNGHFHIGDETTHLHDLFFADEESEDERIRKELVAFFEERHRERPEAYWHDIKVADILFWLEKHKDIWGEKAKNITANMLEDEIEGIQRELIEFLSNAVNASWVDIIRSADAYAERIRNIIEKQKKQRPAESSYPYGRNETIDRLVSIAECLEMDGECLFNGYSGNECGKFLRELARKQFKCKSAEWSEEEAPITDLPKWHSARAGTKLPGEAVIIYAIDPEPRLGKVMVNEGKYMLVKELEKMI